jgi:hypothetical protein
VGRNMFHVTRYQLNDSVPGLRMVVNQNKMVELEVASDVIFDFERLNEAFERGDPEVALETYRSFFLREATCEWAREMRFEFDDRLIEFFVQTLQQLADAGQLERAQRLAHQLEGCVFNDELLYQLIRLTYRVEGVEAARAEWWRIGLDLHRERGQVPLKHHSLWAELELGSGFSFDAQ